MGFPQRVAEGFVSICACHKEAKVGGGYTCPRCKARVCELPTECRICGLTLVSSPHLARSYHHLFPITPFDEEDMRTDCLVRPVGPTEVEEDGTDFKQVSGRERRGRRF